MNSGILIGIVPSVIIVVGALIKIIKQTGRIEEGVKGLYGRVDRLERQSDTRFRR